MKQAAYLGLMMASLVGSSCGEEEEEFQPRTLMKPLPAIENAPFVSADKATTISDKDLVLALTINGHSRAYPINMLTGPRREIINDTLGGTPIAATW